MKKTYSTKSSHDPIYDGSDPTTWLASHCDYCMRSSITLDRGIKATAFTELYLKAEYKGFKKLLGVLRTSSVMWHFRCEVSAEIRKLSGKKQKVHGTHSRDASEWHSSGVLEETTFPRFREGFEAAEALEITFRELRKQRLTARLEILVNHLSENWDWNAATIRDSFGPHERVIYLPERLHDDIWGDEADDEIYDNLYKNFSRLIEKLEPIARVHLDEEIWVEIVNRPYLPPTRHLELFKPEREH